MNGENRILTDHERAELYQELAGSLQRRAQFEAYGDLMGMLVAKVEELRGNPMQSRMALVNFEIQQAMHGVADEWAAKYPEVPQLAGAEYKPVVKTHIETGSVTIDGTPALHELHYGLAPFKFPVERVTDAVLLELKARGDESGNFINAFVELLEQAKAHGKGN